MSIFHRCTSLTVAMITKFVSDHVIQQYSLCFCKLFTAYRLCESDNMEITLRLRPQAEVERQILKRRLRWKREMLAFYHVMFVLLLCAQDTYAHRKDE